MGKHSRTRKQWKRYEGRHRVVTPKSNFNRGVARTVVALPLAISMTLFPTGLGIEKGGTSPLEKFISDILIGKGIGMWFLQESVAVAAEVITETIPDVPAVDELPRA